jgi:single-stranded DNA-binding protein
MAKIVASPQLRYTQDGQLAVTEMMVQFDNLSPNGPPSTLKVISWGNLATEVQEKYTVGDRVILSGRLKMDTIERQEGFKEKRAELTVSSIFPLNASGDNTPTANKVVEMGSDQVASLQGQNKDSAPFSEDESIPDSSPNELDTTGENNIDNIPF